MNHTWHQYEYTNTIISAAVTHNTPVKQLFFNISSQVHRITVSNIYTGCLPRRACNTYHTSVPRETEKKIHQLYS